jgi:hypothetical protein
VEEEVVAGPEEEALDLMEPENDYEDFWANSSSKDTLEKKQMEIRLALYFYWQIRLHNTFIFGDIGPAYCDL